MEYDNITRIIEAKKTGEKKLYFYNSSGEKVTTENFVKDYYEKSGYSVMRAEVNFWQAMSALCFFDEIFSINTNSLNDIPLDLFHNDLFYKARKQIIDEKYNLLKTVKLLDYVNEQIILNGNFKTRLFRYNLPTYKADFIEYFKTTIVQDFLSFIDNNIFADIVYKIAQNPNDNRAGLPDFIIWNDEKFEFIEVKRINEQLREAQINWIKFLLNKNTPIYIVRVKEI